jgi:NAD(P)-dependent dehydrogenase (short-subunit alcohol dehydrogenase family)
MTEPGRRMAIVAGGGRLQGINRAIASRVAREECDLTLVDIRRPALGAARHNRNQDAEALSCTDPFRLEIYI